MITGGSTSVWSTYPIFSQAGAAGRTTLIEEGAKLLGVGPQDCVARQGRVEAGDRSIGYGEIVRRGDLSRRFSADDLKNLKIKTPDKRTLIGKPARALDIPPKTKGQAVYGIDAEVDGMLYARPKLPPTRYGSKVLSVDDTAARKVKGYLRSIVLDDPSGTVPGLGHGDRRDLSSRHPRHGAWCRSYGKTMRPLSFGQGSAGACRRAHRRSSGRRRPRYRAAET